MKPNEGLPDDKKGGVFALCPVWVILLLILLPAALLRLVNFGKAPPGLNQDEAVNAWNAYCLLKTGQDQVGIRWPIFYMRGGGFRKMYAQFLSEAGSILNKPELKETAKMFSESAALWSETAATALGDICPKLKEIRNLAIEKNRIFEEQQPQALDRMHQISETLNGLMREAAQEFPAEKAIALLTEMRQKILLCREKEETAFNRLKSIIE